MFTGIIQHIGRVESVRPQGGGLRLALHVGPLAEGLALGGSLAVNGVCLTARTVGGSRAEFDAVQETVTRTTLGALRAGGRVNLERALYLGDGLDGHLVQGHVDGVAVVRKVEKVAGERPNCVIHFSAGTDLTGQMVPKGSVAVDGVSLTLVDVSNDGFRVSLIPETLERTTLSDLRPGGRVNIETDVLGKYVKKYLSAMMPSAATAPVGEGLTLQKLKDAGFA